MKYWKLLLFLLLFSACKPDRKVSTSFYYWKTIYKNNPAESAWLNHFHTKKLYVRIMDIDIGEDGISPVPVSPILFKDKLPDGVKIVPVVFIVNDLLKTADKSQLNDLANKLILFVDAKLSQAGKSDYREIQMDCDWTAGTRENYFYLLGQLSKYTSVKHRVISVTLRLHQLKNQKGSGIPPVGRVMLMCYNMGNLRKYGTQNSILELSELKKYLGQNIGNYPLPIDIGLPLFSWAVAFRDKQYIGISKSLKITSLNDKNQFKFIGNNLYKAVTDLPPFGLNNGDEIRWESVTENNLNQAATYISSFIKADSLNIIYFHLDKDLINNHTYAGLEKILQYSISLITIFFLGLTLDLACGPEPDPYDYMVSFFHKDISGGKAYRAFYFTSSQPLYSSDEPANEEDVNSREWAKYLGANVKPSDVKKVMYHLNGRADTILLEGYLNLKNGLPDSIKYNTFLRVIIKKKHALLYYRFAKIVEPAVVTHYYWRSDIPDTNYMFKTAKDALKEAKLAKDKFLRLRYYYQAQRLLHYTGHQKEAAKIYDEYIIKSHPDYYIKGLCTALRAGEEWRMGDPARSAYLFSKVFTNFPERRILAYRDYVSLKAPENKVLALAKNNYEKAVIYAMNGFYTPKLSFKYLKKVYATEPRSPFVELLLTREINKLEGAYLVEKINKKLNYNYTDGDYYGWNDSLKKEKNKLSYINQLEQFCTQIASEHKCKNPAFGLVAKAYLEWMTDKNEAGLTTLSQTDSVKLISGLYDQKQFVKLLLISQKIKKLDSVSEKQLVPSLKWLDKKVITEIKNKGEKITDSYNWGDNHRLQTYMWSARDFYQKLLVPIYLRQHDTTKAALAMLKGMPKLTGDTLSCYHADYWDDYTTIDFWQNYLHSSNLSMIVNYKRKGAADPYLTLLTSGLKNTSLDALYNLLGTAYIREHNYRKAVYALSEIRKHTIKDFPMDGYGGERIKSNPFIERLRDYPKDFKTGESGGYSKLRFAKEMYDLEIKAKHSPNLAPQCYFKMATGIYNISNIGNAWYLVSYTWSDGWYETYNKYEIFYKEDRLQTVNAEKFYLKARHLSNNPEFKAKCTFMAAKCRQNRYRGVDNEFERYKLFAEHDSTFREQIRRNQYFAELKKHYSKTTFFKTALSDCSYLRDFLASNDTKATIKIK